MPPCWPRKAGTSTTTSAPSGPGGSPGGWGDGVRKLHARNVAVIGGAGITEPVSALVCWTMRGRVAGGTGLAIRLAQAAGIPVFNLASVHPRDVCLALNRIARETRADNAV